MCLVRQYVCRKMVEHCGERGWMTRMLLSPSTIGGHMKKGIYPQKNRLKLHLYIYRRSFGAREHKARKRIRSRERERKCESNPFVLLLKLATQLSVRRTTTHHSLLGWRLKSAQMIFLFSVAARTNTSRATFVHI